MQTIDLRFWPCTNNQVGIDVIARVSHDTIVAYESESAASGRIAKHLEPSDEFKLKAFVTHGGSADHG